VKSFASDNCSGAHPSVIEALSAANRGHVPSYGADPLTHALEERFREHFGESVRAFVVFNGTGANVLALAACARPYESVLCASSSHIHVDECGAPERFSGSKVIAIPPDSDGKLSPDGVAPFLKGFGDPHHAQPRVLSISQTTELGSVYSVEELRALAETAHRHGMVLHLDGARLSNAAAALGVSLAALTRDVGVDVVSFGGTKNGLLGAEAVVFLNGAHAEGFEYVRKQGLQLASKMRFLSAQFLAYFENDLWLKNARHANGMAALLAEEAARVPGVRLSHEAQANAVFALLPKSAIARLQALHPFYIWDDRGADEQAEVRWMTSWDTTEGDVREFVASLRQSV
jgi:threonine aldolase